MVFVIPVIRKCCLDLWNSLDRCLACLASFMPKKELLSQKQDEWFQRNGIWTDLALHAHAPTKTNKHPHVYTINISDKYLFSFSGGLGLNPGPWVHWREHLLPSSLPAPEGDFFVCLDFVEMCTVVSKAFCPIQRTYTARSANSYIYYPHLLLNETRENLYYCSLIVLPSFPWFICSSPDSQGDYISRWGLWYVIIPWRW